MLAVFEQLLSNEALVDVTLACEGLSLKAHKMVLSACSPFFQALFIENPCKHPIVIMKDMRYMDLKAIVEFMYRGEVNVSQDQLSALLKTAETLKVKGLAEVTGENKHGALVSVDGADPKPVGTPRAESPPLSKRKRGRPRRRSPSDSNKSDSEDQGGPPATRIKGPESPEIIEDGSMSSDRVTTIPAASPSSRTSTTVAVSSTAVSTGAVVGSTAKATNSLAATSQHTQDSMGDDVGEGDDADFEVEPSNLMEQSMTTENVPVFTEVASSQPLGNESQQSHHTGSTSDSTALVPVQASLPSDISISSQVDIKPSPSSLIPYDDQAISPVVAAPPAAAASSAEGSNMAMMFMDTSGVPAIAGPSNYHPDKQQSTPSHVSAILPRQASLRKRQWVLSVGELEAFNTDAGETNAILQALCHKNGYGFVDGTCELMGMLKADGVHPTKRGSQRPFEKLELIAEATNHPKNLVRSTVCHLRYFFPQSISEKRQHGQTAIRKRSF